MVTAREVLAAKTATPYATHATAPMLHTESAHIGLPVAPWTPVTNQLQLSRTRNLERAQTGQGGNMIHADPPAGYRLLPPGTLPGSI